MSCMVSITAQSTSDTSNTHAKRYVEASPSFKHGKKAVPCLRWLTGQI